MAYDKTFSMKSFEDQVKKGVIRGRAEREAARVLYDVRPLTRDEDEMRLVPSQHWNPEEDITLEEYLSMKKDEEKRKKGLSTKAKEFIPGKYSIRSKSRKSRKSTRKSRKERKSVRKSRKSSRKSRKSARKSRKACKSTRKSRKSRKSTRKSRKTRKSTRKSRKVRKSTRKSRKVRKSTRKSRKARKSRKSSRRSRRKSIGKRERACKDLLKEKVGINLKEYEDGRYLSRQQAIAVAYSQVKKMKPSCSKYFKRKDL